MKINEITDKNISWKNLMEFDLNFDDEFQKTVKFASIVLQVKHRNKFPQAKAYIDTFNKRAMEFLNAKPFDPTDPDIIILQNKVSDMISRLTELEHRLI